MFEDSVSTIFPGSSYCEMEYQGKWVEDVSYNESNRLGATKMLEERKTDQQKEWKEQIPNHPIKLSKKEEETLKKAFKRGIYKELYEEKQLTEATLHLLLDRHDT